MGEVAARAAIAPTGFETRHEQAWMKRDVSNRQIRLRATPSGRPRANVLDVVNTQLREAGDVFPHLHSNLFNWAMLE
jgi:hypothetical protein